MLSVCVSDVISVMLAEEVSRGHPCVLVLVASAEYRMKSKLPEQRTGMNGTSRNKLCC